MAPSETTKTRYKRVLYTQKHPKRQPQNFIYLTKVSQEKIHKRDLTHIAAAFGEKLKEPSLRCKM